MRAQLQEGWVIANHILVSFHVAFISSVLALPSASILKGEVLRFIFASPETVISALFVVVSFHTGIALHEMGHFLTAARLNALNEAILPEVQRQLQQPLPARLRYLAGLFLRIPYGKAVGVKREGLNYYPDAPYNLAVAAAGPRASRNAALATLPPAGLLLAIGLFSGVPAAIYVGRLLLGIGVVCVLDFLLADPGKYAAFKERERRAELKARSVDKVVGWLNTAPVAKRKMTTERMWERMHPKLGPVTAPWQFRNCGMGGRHTEKEYPESNISMQEAMFLLLSPRDYQEAQELTVRLQNRLKEMIEKEEGCRVMGIGLEGGLAPYIEKGSYPLPEVRLWDMMKRAIAECGCQPGRDVAIALDPAMSELENAYREEFNVPDAVGTYLFWRDKSKTVMDRDGLLDIYVKAIEEYEIPLLSIEDGFSERDAEGWRMLLERLGDRIFVIGDDLVTTNDQTIEVSAGQGLINAALIKANQIGSLYETLLAMLVALGKGLELVVSHRSKSPNDDMEAQIALAVNALGLKAGGGANTERLVKYQAVTELMLKVEESNEENALHEGERALIRKVRAYEEPTNAGVPTVGATLELSLPDSGVMLKFKGATPLGTSAGTAEAIHLVDALVEYAEHHEAIDRFPSFFRQVERGVFAFRKDAQESRVAASGDEELKTLYHRAQRYQGKGCLNAVDNVLQIIAPYFEGRNVAAISLRDTDRALLELELREARRRRKLDPDAGAEALVAATQRKQNLGMNAMLSVSLSLARAIAHIQGKELYELLREEMVAVIDRLADAFSVPVRGSRFSDYVAALRGVSRHLEARGRPLYRVLRGLTGIYADAEAGVALPSPPPVRPVEHDVPAAALRIIEALAERLGPSYAANAHHGLRHAHDVLRSAVRLAWKLGIQGRVDWRVLGAAVCLHDLASAVKSHATESAAQAEALLEELDGFPPQDARKVLEAIRLHEDRSEAGAARRADTGLEAQLLYDADQLEAFGVKGIYRYVTAYTARGTPLETIRENAEARYTSLTFDASREVAAADYAYTTAFVEKLLHEGPAEDRTVGASGAVNWIRDHSAEPPLAMADEALAALETAGDGGLDEADRDFTAAFFSALRAAYRAEAPPLPAPPTPRPVAPPTVAPPTDLAKVPPERFDAAQARAVADLNRELYRVHVAEEKGADAREALLCYFRTKGEIASERGRFGIINNRLFKGERLLIVPYLLGTTLNIHAVREGETESILTRRLPHGTIYTDALVLGLSGLEGEPVDLEPVDLEKEIFVFDVAQVEEPRVTRIRDLADLLRRANRCTNRNEAVYWLRYLVARLCNLPVQAFLRAKNLQPEINILTAELVALINGPLSRRLPLLVRLLVRNLSGLVGKPNLIDRLWNDTIDLAEVHIRGSAVVNELRRSSHHALGRRTLQIAEAYREFLATGDSHGLTALRFAAPTQADIEARTRSAPREILERVVHDLARLLGTSEVMMRIREWREAYAQSLVRCEFGESLADHLETLITKGVRAKNRWVYFHHLRILSAKAEDFVQPPGIGEDFKRVLERMQALKPDEPGFESNRVEAELREAIDGFVREIREAHQDGLFRSLDEVLETYEARAFFDTFTRLRQLRVSVAERTQRGGFTEQRYYLGQLDCLLEEMGYLALRHIATAYHEEGVNLDQCLEIIRLSIRNLEINGTASRELYDLGAMLTPATRTDAELLNILESIERDYHKIRQRVTVPYEKLHHRLGLGPEELRTVLANMQRYMHDLNSMVHFADIAASHIRDLMSAGSERPQPAPEEAGEVAALGAVVHLSHREEIAALVANGDGQPNARDCYGGKGSGLAYISHLGVPTRDAFVLPTTFARSGFHRREPARLQEEIERHIRILEEDIARRDGSQRRFGDEASPLLLAVRGGSVFSMPGILSTVVFVGINDRIAEALARDDAWCAYDSYRRFLASYAWAVWNVDFEVFDLVEETKRRYGVKHKQDLPWEAMREIVEASKSVLRNKGYGDPLDEILEDPDQQLFNAVTAVFDSWLTDTARRYREIKGICHSWHTATVVQEMAFGNRSNDTIGPGMDETRASLTGVIPRTFITNRAVREFEGEIKFSAAGDDLVAGVTTSTSFRPVGDLPTLMPSLEMRLKHIVAKLRRFMGTDQEIEFTVERGVLSVLQSRTAETVAEKVTNRFVDPGEPATRGLGVRGSAFRGLVVFDEVGRDELAGLDLGDRDDVDGVLMLLENPTPDDIPIIISADGLLTAKGGSTSHAAVAVNGIEDRSFSAVMSAANLHVHSKRQEATIVDDEGKALHRIRKGDILSIHGTSGEVYLGSRPLDASR